MTKRWRLMRMGLQTVLGLRRQGFFIPYRYAQSVEAPGSYPALEALFRDHESAFQTVLNEIEKQGPALEALNVPAPQPRWDQDWFPRLDGASAFALIRYHTPKRIIEVGSGHSTRFLAAAGDARITCIDPQPRADFGDLEIEWHQAVLDESHFALFDELQAGDIAFFDSSHLMMPGTDVDMIFNRIIPRLKPGVLIHIHDILFPDPYPDSWEWRGYSEQNALGGWLLSGALKPVFSSRYVATRMKAAQSGVLSRLPLKRGAIETSLWVQKAF